MDAHNGSPHAVEIRSEMRRMMRMMQKENRTQRVTAALENRRSMCKAQRQLASLRKIRAAISEERQHLRASMRREMTQDFELFHKKLKKEATARKAAQAFNKSPHVLTRICPHCSRSFPSITRLTEHEAHCSHRPPSSEDNRAHQSHWTTQKETRRHQPSRGYTSFFTRFQQEQIEPQEDDEDDKHETVLKDSEHENLKWSRLKDSYSCIKFHDIPWIPLDAVYDGTPESFGLLRAGPVDSLADRKQSIKLASLRWMPDKFLQSFGRRLSEDDRPRILHSVNLMAQIVNDFRLRLQEEQQQQQA